MATGKGQIEIWPPTWRTVPHGACVWVRYTHTQWMLAAAIYGNKKALDVTLLGGELRRTLPIPWADVAWHPPDDALIAGEDRHSTDGYCQRCHRNPCRHSEVRACRPST